MPTLCICGEPFSVVHAMSCPTGGYPTIRHNELRDQLAATVTEVCHSVAVEPLLAPVEGERFLAASTTVAPEARSDFCASGFWTRGQMAHFDVRVFHADAPSYADKPIADLFRSQERQKKLKERIINVEHASFCPLIFSTTGAAVHHALVSFRALLPCWLIIIVAPPILALCLGSAVAFHLL